MRGKMKTAGDVWRDPERPPKGKGTETGMPERGEAGGRKERHEAR